MSVTILHGDNRELILTLAECSIDSVVTDPPYALVSIVNRFGADDAAPAKSNGATGVYRRAAAGFMGQRWDNGETAFDPAFWRQVYRVLKPGGHVLAFGGTRTYHRLACAIEDAGFEIRDMVAWLYGSGFPKSHDVSKGIDKAAGLAEARGYIEATGGLHGGSGDTVGCFTGRQLAPDPVSADAIRWNGWGTALKPALEPIVLARKPLIGTVAENVLAHSTGALNIDGSRVATWDDDPNLCASCAAHVASSGKRSTLEIKESSATRNVAPITNGMASASQADTDKMGIGCSVGMKAGDIDTSSSIARPGKKQGAQSQSDTRFTTSMETKATIDLVTCASCGQPIIGDCIKQSMGATRGRWPSNLIHDGSDEVVAGFPETGEARASDRGTMGFSPFSEIDGSGRNPGSNGIRGHDDSGGSAARFFYTAKADETDRVASRHPTVKPVDLMQYLCRLVTPPGGCVLDPFAGSGSTGEAAVREGFRAVLIEREAEYVADIKRRMELAMAGPEEKQRAIIKAKGKVESVEGLPLFGGPME